jgi:hypothetical protein
MMIFLITFNEFESHSEPGAVGGHEKASPREREEAGSKSVSWTLTGWS